MTMSETPTQRDERIDLRVSSELKTLFARAASYSGMSLSSFLVTVAAERAREVVAEHEILALTPRDWQAFLAVLDAPEPPRPNLRAAATRYRKRRAKRDAG
jgi:uncharacterized protein (DUF1778 family)